MIVILAVGNPAYGQFAHNLAISIKHHCNLPMQLIYDAKAVVDTDMSLFDVVTEMRPEHCYMGNKVMPGKAKLNIYEYLAFDECLYLDADTLVIRDLSGLKFEKYYQAEINGTGTVNDEKWGDEMVWATPKKIAEYYDLDGKAIPFINTSYQFIRKGKEAEELYRNALANLENAIPYKEHLREWGRRIPTAQPDELYMDVACAQVDHNPSGESLIYFRPNRTVGKETADIFKEHYAIGYYCSLEFNHKSIYTIYDTEMRKYCAAAGRHHTFTINNLMRNKFIKRG